MYTVCILSPTDEPSSQVVQSVEQEGIAWNPGRAAEGEAIWPAGAAPDGTLLDLTLADGVQDALLVERGRSLRVPLVAVLSAGRMSDFDFSLGADDFIICPWWSGELTFRLRQLLGRPQAASEAPDAPGVIRAADLVIDPQRYDVHVAGKKVLLTFKEYELLKLLASTPGRVYSRDKLLDQVWGYQYFGGTRTVDVHVRRLRSKIEDASHTFIETVRNVGYRFRALS